MTNIADEAVIIQASSESVPSPPSWLGEVALIVGYLRKQGVLTKISEHVRFARRRFGHYEVIDFLAVLFGYAISGERTLEEFYQRIQPFALPVMARAGPGSVALPFRALPVFSRVCTGVPRNLRTLGR